MQFYEFYDNRMLDSLLLLFLMQIGIFSTLRYVTNTTDTSIQAAYFKIPTSISVPDKPKKSNFPYKKAILQSPFFTSTFSLRIMTYLNTTKKL